MPFIKSRPLKLVFEIPTSRTQRFWEGIKDGEIYTTRCKGCGTLHFPPVGDCPECLSSEMEWVKLDGRGEVEAFTHVIARPLSFQHHEPYTIVIGRLIEGVRVLAWLRDVDITEVEVGMRVRLTVGTTPEGETTYWFVPL
jgi:hypothetical protein